LKRNTKHFLKTPLKRRTGKTRTMPQAVTEENALEEATQVDLFGEFRFKVDAKGRVALPAKFRKALPDGLIVSRNLNDDCLFVFEPKGFNAWVKQLFIDRFGKFDTASNKHSRLRAGLKARASEVLVDSAGRISLKSDLREAVGITKDVVIVGNTGYFEIWDSAKFDETIGNLDFGEIFGSGELDF
jgi:MraZ protein